MRLLRIACVALAAVLLVTTLSWSGVTVYAAWVADELRVQAIGFLDAAFVVLRHWHWA